MIPEQDVCWQRPPDGKVFHIDSGAQFAEDEGRHEHKEYELTKGLSGGRLHDPLHHHCNLKVGKSTSAILVSIRNGMIMQAVADFWRTW